MNDNKLRQTVTEIVVKDILKNPNWGGDGRHVEHHHRLNSETGGVIRYTIKRWVVLPTTRQASIEFEGCEPIRMSIDYQDDGGGTVSVYCGYKHGTFVYLCGPVTDRIQWFGWQEKGLMSSE
jgi:hypothetical protein